MIGENARNFVHIAIFKDTTIVGLEFNNRKIRSTHKSPISTQNPKLKATRKEAPKLNVNLNETKRQNCGDN
jgi:hypothetical protein